MVKFFEITNTLADVILCTSAVFTSISPQHHPNDRLSYTSRKAHQKRERCLYGPADFLHGLFQTISPFLEGEKALNDVLRQKAAEAFLRAPNRTLPNSLRDLSSEGDDTDHRNQFGVVEHENSRTGETDETGLGF